jgi:hypothetical protein
MRTKILALVYALSFLLFDVPPATAAIIGAASASTELNAGIVNFQIAYDGRPR